MMLDFWVQLPQAGGVASARNVRAYAALAEELGFTGVWLGDHIALPDEYSSAYPYGAAHPVAADRPFLEALTTLAYVAGATRRLRLAVAVLVAPYRHPLLQAKQIATIDALSNGRLEVGFGSGWLAEEFEALGLDFDDRGSITDETIALMSALWTGESVSHTGRHFTLDGIRCLPRPAQAPGPPIWIGGNSTRALRRVVDTGAGWIAPAQTADELGSLIGRLRRLGNGRGQRVAASMTVAIDGSAPTESGAPERPSIRLGGPPDVLDGLRRSGVTDIRLELTTLPPRERLGAIAKLARMLEDAGLKSL
jgi:probable F420-dependent oxidoreductase